jgi:hypothetical protein
LEYFWKCISRSIYKEETYCLNRSNGKSVTQSTTTNKPNYYNKFAKQPKPKMSNSFELLTGPVSDIQKKYEILSDIVSSNGKAHGPHLKRLQIILYH